MPTAIRIKNDAIVPGAHDPLEVGFTPRELQTRIAFFILGSGAPLVAALFAVFTTKRWWTQTHLWSFPRLCALWFLSISIVAIAVFVLPERTTRSTFVTAVIHGMVEVTMISFLLNHTLSQALIAAMIFSLVDFAVTFAVADIGYVFVFVAIIGGVNDFLMSLLLFYGRQPLLAIGTAGHTLAAVALFTAIVHNYGVIPFTLISFFALWLNVGFIIAGLRASRVSNTEYPVNPMKVSVPHSILALFILISLVGSTMITLFLAYVAPNK